MTTTPTPTAGDLVMALRSAHTALLGAKTVVLLRVHPTLRARIDRSLVEIDTALAASPALPAQSGAVMRALLDKALTVLDSYADPTGYTDNSGEFYEAGETVYPGVLARDTAADIRSALSSPAPEGEADLTDDELSQLGCELHEAYVNGELLAPEGEAGMADVSIGALLRNNSVPGAPEGGAAQGVRALGFEPDEYPDGVKLLAWVAARDVLGGDLPTYEQTCSVADQMVKALAALALRP